MDRPPRSRSSFNPRRRWTFRSRLRSSAPGRCVSFPSQRKRRFHPRRFLLSRHHYDNPVRFEWEWNPHTQASGLERSAGNHRQRFSFCKYPSTRPREYAPLNCRPTVASDGGSNSPCSVYRDFLPLPRLSLSSAFSVGVPQRRCSGLKQAGVSHSWHARSPLPGSPCASSQEIRCARYDFPLTRKVPYPPDLDGNIKQPRSSGSTPEVRRRNSSITSSGNTRISLHRSIDRAIVP